MPDRNFEDNSTFKKMDDVVARKSSNDGVVVLMKMDDSSSFFKINGVASEVWDMINQEIPTNQVIDNLEKNYTVGRKQIESDVHCFLDKLLDMDIIRV
jgi:hypothetical protein